MKQVKLLTGNEVKIFFRSSLGPFILFLFLLITGIVYLNLILTYISRYQEVLASQIPPTAFLDEVFFRFYGYLNFLFLFFIPLISMNAFADKEQMKMVSFYQLNRVSVNQLILSKWLTAMCVCGLLLILTSVFPVLMYFVGFEEISLIISSNIGILFNICLYCMIGLFCSAFFKVSFVSGFSAIAIIMFFWMLKWISHSIDNMFISSFLDKLSMLSYFENIARGMIQLSQVSYLVGFLTMFFLLIQLKLKKSRV